MIRFARESDIPAILDIYRPYVLNTAISFEYSVPTLEEFTERFRNITAQFPWLVWEEAGTVLVMPTAAHPLAGPPTGGWLPLLFTLLPISGERASAPNSMPLWKAC